MNAVDPRLQGLYVITDRVQCMRRGLVDSVADALAGGARLVQYRDKSQDHRRRFEEALQLSGLCAAHGAAFIINDDVRLARATGAHGVHLGRDDTSVADARALLGTHAIIGVSCYDDFTLAEAGARAGADYVAFGSVFPSSTKPDAVRAPMKLFRRASEELSVPSCAIGGINRDNIGEAVRAGATMLAVVSAVFAAGDIEAATRELIGKISASREPRAANRK